MNQLIQGELVVFFQLLNFQSLPNESLIVLCTPSSVVLTHHVVLVYDLQKSLLYSVKLMF